VELALVIAPNLVEDHATPVRLEGAFVQVAFGKTQAAKPSGPGIPGW
jgi:hypothetical protein